MVQINDVVPRLLLQARTDMQANPDHMGGHQPVIETGHRFVHLGVHFFHTQAVELDSADTVFQLIVTPAHGSAKTECHLIYTVETGLSADIEFYEGVTGDDPTGIPLNSRRNSTNAAESRCGSSLTGYTGGTLLEKFLVGSGGGNTRGGGGASRDNEIVLDQSTLYALKITSNANANRISSRFSWYEVGANVIGG